MKKLITLLLIVAVTMITSCGAKTESTSLSSATTDTASVSEVFGTLLLSINPEIEIKYDEQGKVLELEGKNSDGLEVLSEYTDYQGKDCQIVIDELIKKIYADGYFNNTVDGHEKNIVIKLENGSQCPDENFMKNLQEKVQTTISECKLTSSSIIIEKDDLREDGMLSPEKAKEIVLTQLDLTNAEFTKADYDSEDGTYEMKFTANGLEYEFEVDAVSGKVIKSETEISREEDAEVQDDNDVQDDDDDQNNDDNQDDIDEPNDEDDQDDIDDHDDDNQDDTDESDDNDDHDDNDEQDDGDVQNDIDNQDDDDDDDHDEPENED